MQKRSIGMVYKGKTFGSLTQATILIQQPPMKRTIVTTEGQFFLSFPWMFFVIEYENESRFWQAPRFKYRNIKVFVSNSSFTSLKNIVAPCPLPMHNIWDATICMGDTINYHQNFSIISQLTDYVIAAYWSGQWVNNSLSHGVDFDLLTESPRIVSLSQWRDRSQSRDFVSSVDWVPKIMPWSKPLKNYLDTLWLTRSYFS